MLGAEAAKNTVVVTSIFGELYSINGGKNWSKSIGGGLSQSVRYIGEIGKGNGLQFGASVSIFRTPRMPPASSAVFAVLSAVLSLLPPFVMLTRSGFWRRRGYKGLLECMQASKDAPSPTTRASHSSLTQPNQPSSRLPGESSCGAVCAVCCACAPPPHWSLRSTPPLPPPPPAHTRTRTCNIPTNIPTNQCCARPPARVHMHHQVRCLP